MPWPEEKRASDFGERDDLKKIDEDILKNCSPGVLMNAILQGRYLEPKIVNRLKKGRLLGVHNQRAINDAIAKAVYDIPTCRGYFINAQFEPHNDKRCVLRTAATILPWADGGENVGPMYLCMNVAYSRKESLVARLRIVKLTVEGIQRTVLVTDHVCDRIMERAGIEGSHVAFVADSIVFNKQRIAKQPNEELLLTIFDRYGQAIGYCPISKIRCGLQRTQDPLKMKGGRDCISVQIRWRLKSFLPIEYFAEADDGCLIPNRTNK